MDLPWDYTELSVWPVLSQGIERIVWYRKQREKPSMWKRRKIEVLTIFRLKIPLAFHLHLFPPFKLIIAQNGKETSKSTTVIPAGSRFQQELWLHILFPGRKYPDIEPYILLFSRQARFISVLAELSLWTICLAHSCQVHYVICTCLLSYVPEIFLRNIAREPNENQLIFWSTLDSLKLQMIQYFSSTLAIQDWSKHVLKLLSTSSNSTQVYWVLSGNGNKEIIVNYAWHCWFLENVFLIRKCGKKYKAPRLNYKCKQETYRSRQFG